MQAKVGSGKFIVGGNWKCNGTKTSVSALLEELKRGDVGENVDVVVAPPFLFIDEAMEALDAPYEVAAQNCWVEPGLVDPTHHYDSDTGAFTGEVSAEMLEDLGVPWVILGHSERRAAPHNESNEFVGKKVAHARFHGLNVIVCVGESLEERESGKTAPRDNRRVRPISGTARGGLRADGPAESHRRMHVARHAGYLQQPHRNPARRHDSPRVAQRFVRQR